VAGRWVELRWTDAGGEAKAAKRSSTLISPKTDPDDLDPSIS